MPKIKPSAAAVKRMYGNAAYPSRKPCGGWGDFKHKLVRLGVIASTADDVPVEWVRAFQKACGQI